MGVGQIRFGGLVSGLDTNAIISAILDAAANPIRLLERQKLTEESKLSLIGTLEGLVTALQEKASAFNSGSFFAFSTSSSNEDVAAFTVDGDALAGTYEVNVTQLAKADRYTFTGVADADADLGAGTIGFDYDGTNYSIAIASGSASLNEIAAQINDEAGDAVRASVVNVGAEGSPSYQLVIAGNDTGADFQIQNLTTDFAVLGTASNLTTAQNAQVTVDSLVIERSTNEFNDVLEGVSFTAQVEGTTTFAVNVDNEATKEKLKEVLDAYNDVISFINEQNSYTEEGGVGGGLFGDSVLRTVRGAISTALFDVDIMDVQADTEGYSTLGLVGVELDSDGLLSIDDTTFDEKLEGNRNLLASLFTDSESGLFVEMDEAIDGIVDSTTTASGIQLEGTFDSRRTTIGTLVDSFDSQIERIERRLAGLEQSLIQQFSNLESLLSGLQAQSSFLAANLGSQ